MVSSAATTVDAYLAAQPADRRASLAAVREVVNRNLPAGFVEGMAFGMIGWAIPLARFPDTYNKQPLGIVAPDVQPLDVQFGPDGQLYVSGTRRNA